jgi:glutaredoxin-related protein
MDREIVGRSSANVAHHLEGMHFPSSKEDLLVRARDNGAGQDMLEVLESFPNSKEFGSLADVMKAFRESDQAPQTGILERKP